MRVTPKRNALTHPGSQTKQTSIGVAVHDAVVQKTHRTRLVSGRELLRTNTLKSSRPPHKSSIPTKRQLEPSSRTPTPKQSNLPGTDAACAWWWQRRIRMDNEKYLRSHSELAQISKVLISEVLREAPEDPVKFVSEYMTRQNLKARVVKTAETI
eukprot:CAMPEP_0180376792 /NCGR_PEP_ID=MMETSP0989-20121125/23648_1 /TAXON_ID=697907 /ORGANISM="non described non described, Strain CCMP2293" /LENGTH=154 /DNA_ID=CAMNT_0022375119 /DNA_START=610 /DNA_END=1071 /DNA_ORIENTATION=-